MTEGEGYKYGMKECTLERAGNTLMSSLVEFITSHSHVHRGIKIG
jgi:hypothetical protein